MEWSRCTRLCDWPWANVGRIWRVRGRLDQRSETMNQFWAGRWPRDCFGLQDGPRRDVSSIRPSSTVTLSRRGASNHLNNTAVLIPLSRACRCVIQSTDYKIWENIIERVICVGLLYSIWKPLYSKHIFSYFQKVDSFSFMKIFLNTIRTV